MDKSVGVKTASHLGEECHKEDQRKEKGLIFHGEWAEGSIGTENKFPLQKSGLKYGLDCDVLAELLPANQLPTFSEDPDHFLGPQPTDDLQPRDQ